MVRRAYPGGANVGERRTPRPLRTYPAAPGLGAYGASKSQPQPPRLRTIANYWLWPLMPENALLLNARDAQRLGLRGGQQVKVVSATNPAGEWDYGISATAARNR